MTLCLVGGALALSPAGGQCADDEEESAVPIAKSPELEAVARLVDLAWSDDPAAGQAVRNAYESQLPRVADRARWHFAYGVAALKLKRHAAAATAFQAAIHDAKSFRFSHWKALIWTELTLKHHEAALKQIEALAAELAAEEFSGTAEMQQQAASWIGQTLAAVEKLNASPKIRRQLAQTDELLAERWNDDLLEACQAGKDYTNTLYDELMDQVQSATDDAKSKEKRTIDQKQTRLKEDTATADEKKAALQKMAEDLKKQAEQRLLQIDKQLVRLERDYNYLEARAFSLMQSMSLLQDELTDHQRRRSANNNQNALGNSFDPRIQQLNITLGLYQQELQATSNRAAFVSQQAMNGLQTRGQLIEQVQTTTSNLAGEHQSLSKWQQRMTQQADKLQKTKLKGDSSSVRAKRAKAKTLSTYLEFDLDWERILLTERPDRP